MLPSLVHRPHLGAGTGPQGSCAPTCVLDFNAAGEDPEALGHFLIADLPVEQARTRASQSLGAAPHTNRQAPTPSPGRLIEGDCADVQLLDLIDGANGEGAVVCQCQAANKGLGSDRVARGRRGTSTRRSTARQNGTS